MRYAPNWSSLHAGDLTASNQPTLADYPVSLLTRRTFGQMSGGILAARRHAPQPVTVRSVSTRRRPQ